MSENHDQPATLKLSEVSKATGIPSDVLRTLIEDGELPGVVRSKSGSVSVREDLMPTWRSVVGALERGYERQLAIAESAMKRVRIEVEAVENDLAMAREDPRLPLGDDLASFRSMADQRSGSSLVSALHRLEMATWGVRQYHEALRRARQVT